MKKTTSASLQAQLDRWTAMAAAAIASGQLADLLDFVDSFAPPDVTKDDREQYAITLHQDKVGCFQFVYIAVIIFTHTHIFYLIYYYC